MRVDALNLVEVLEQHIDIKVKGDIVKALTDKYVNELRETLKRELETVTFEGIESIRDALDYRDEVRVNIKIEDNRS